MLQQKTSSKSSDTDASLSAVDASPDSFPEKTPADDNAAVPRKLPVPADSSTTQEMLSGADVFADSAAKHVQPDAPVAIGSNQKKKKISKTVNFNAEEATKDVGVQDHPQQQSARFSHNLPSPAVPLVTVATPLEPRLLLDPLLSADLASAAQRFSTPQPSKVPFDPLTSASGLTSRTLAAAWSTTASSSATAGPGGVATMQAPFPALVPETTSFATCSTVAASSVAAKPKAQPQAAISSGRDGILDNDATPAFITSQIDSDIDPSLARGLLINHSPAATQSALRSGAESSSSRTATRSDRSRSQSASPSDNLSGAQEKSADDATTGNRYPKVDFASAVTAHSSPLQLSPVTPAATPTPTTATPEAASSASAVFVQPSQSPTTVSVHAGPQIQSNPIPDPPRMVDSGQLRVTANRSELKISVQLPDLGKVEIHAVTAHNITTAHLTASGHNALQILAADRTGLEQALKTRDVILGTLNASTQGQSAGQQRPQHFQPQAQSLHRTSSIATAAGSSAADEARTAEFLPDHSSISVRA